MGRSIALAVLVTATLLLAGCSGGGKDNDPDPKSSSTSSSSRSTSSTSSSSSSTTTGAPAPGTMALNFTRGVPNGPVPLAVNFTLSGSFTRGGSTQVAPDGLSWTIRIVNGTTLANLANATAGPTGTTLPATFNLTFTDAGDYLVLANVTATGYTPSSATIQIAAVAAGPGAPIFFDGAEGDASQWTITSHVYINLLLPAPNPTYETTTTPHPEGGWVINDADKKTGAKSWLSPYPDNYRTRMTSVAFNVPASGATLSYSLKGGAESNTVDGVHVLVGESAAALTEVAYHTGAAIDWTQFTASLSSLAGKSGVVQFRFDADSGCSNDGPPGPVAGQICGAGFDAGGFRIDDIQVA